MPLKYFYLIKCACFEINVRQTWFTKKGTAKKSMGILHKLFDSETCFHLTLQFVVFILQCIDVRCVIISIMSVVFVLYMSDF